MDAGLLSYLAISGLFLLLALAQVGNYRVDQSDVKQMRLLLAVVLGLLSIMFLGVGFYRHG